MGITGKHTTDIGGLHRPRLINSLEGIRNGRLGLVTGPPGTGKTTLLEQWAAATDATVAWCHPDLGNHGRLLDELQRVAAAVVESAGSHSLEPPGRFGAQRSKHVVIVLDEADRFSEQMLVADLHQFLSRTPSWMKLLLSGCGRPGLNMAKSELSTAVSITGDDLRFRAHEVDRLFRRVYGQPLSCPGVLNVTRQTDGWAAALRLFHLSVQERSHAERNKVAETLSAVTGFIYDYLSDHVLSRATAEQLGFLEAVSVFDGLTAERCDALLGTGDSRQYLHELARRCLLLGGEDGRTYHMAFVLRQYLRSSPSPRHRTTHRQVSAAEVLEGEGNHPEAMDVRARQGDWEGIRRSFSEVGSRAIVAGLCGWSASTPESLEATDPWLAVASARRLLDDGNLTGAATAAGRALALGGTDDCLDVASTIQRHAALWAGEPVPGPDQRQPSDVLLNAVRSNPGGAARHLAARDEQAGCLAAGLALLLAGDQRSALPVLRRSASCGDKNSAEALSARLALAVFGAAPLKRTPTAAEAEIEAVARDAERRGFTWLSRLAEGVCAAVSRRPPAKRLGALIADFCDAREDRWGAALVHTASALSTLRSGLARPADFEALAARFRSLSAGSLEAWAHSAYALTAAGTDIPEADAAADTAAAFARSAGVPGALALAFAAKARQDPSRYGEFTTLAVRTACDAGLVCRPWTWLAAPIPLRAIEGAERHDDALVPADPPACAAIRCLGGFSLRIGNAEVDLSHLRPQARTVLRVLAINAGRPVHRERLVDALWSDMGPRPTLHTLQVHISNLRQLIPQESGDHRAPLITRVGEAYMLILDGRSAFDMADFDACLREGFRARATGDFALAARYLQCGVDLYRGEVLPEDGEAEWITEVRERYRLRAAEAATLLAQTHLALGKGSAAVTAATRSIEIDPWRDESWRTLLAVYRSEGDVLSAERAQQRYERMLAGLDVGVQATTGARWGPVLGSGPTVARRTPPRLSRPAAPLARRSPRS